MTEQPVAWIATGMVVRENGGGVSLADIETIWEAMHEHLAVLGLRVAATRAVPLSQTELESGDLFKIMEADHSKITQPL